MERPTRLSRPGMVLTRWPSQSGCSAASGWPRWSASSSPTSSSSPRPGPEHGHSASPLRSRAAGAGSARRGGLPRAQRHFILGSARPASSTPSRSKTRRAQTHPDSRSCRSPSSRTPAGPTAVRLGVCRRDPPLEARTAPAGGSPRDRHRRGARGRYLVDGGSNSYSRRSNCWRSSRTNAGLQPKTSENSSCEASIICR